jgi:hypothetical protein
MKNELENPPNSESTNSPKDYSQIPWYRKSSWNQLLFLATFLSFGLFPGVLLTCIILLTGDIYLNKKDEKGYLKKWPWANKAVAGLLLLLSLARTIHHLATQ